MVFLLREGWKHGGKEWEDKKSGSFESQLEEDTYDSSFESSTAAVAAETGTPSPTRLESFSSEGERGAGSEGGLEDGALAASS